VSVSATDGKGDKQTIASDFSDTVKGKLADATIEAVVQALETAAICYPVLITFTKVPFYATIGVAVQGGKRFEGTFGPPNGIGMGVTVAGVLYTENMELLYSDTRSFEILSTAAYMGVLFFSGNFALLGHVQAASLFPASLIVSGSGRWY
jgi:hypothetical protein